MNAGRHCETDINNCASAPCLNGGRCIDQVAGYRCVCQIEYVGDTCSHHVCDSDQSPCLNGGSCYVEDHQPLCLCPAAFTGAACQTNRCLGVTCGNAGTCENGICICQPGESWAYINFFRVSDHLYRNLTLSAFNSLLSVAMTVGSCGVPNS